MVMMRQVQGKAQKANHRSGSGPARLTRVRHSPMITGQFWGQARYSVHRSQSRSVESMARHRHDCDSAEGLGLSLNRVAHGQRVWMEAPSEAIKVYSCTRGPHNILCFSGVIFHTCKNYCREQFSTRGLYSADRREGWSVIRSSQGLIPLFRGCSSFKSI